MDRTVLASLEKRLRQDAARIFEAGVDRVRPARCILEYCSRKGDYLHLGPDGVDLSQVERVIILGAGKASAALAAALAPLLTGTQMAGLIVTKYGHGVEAGPVRIREAGHPVPDENGVKGAGELLALAGSAG